MVGGGGGMRYFTSWILGFFKVPFWPFSSTANETSFTEEKVQTENHWRCIPSLNPQL